MSHINLAPEVRIKVYRKAIREADKQRYTPAWSFFRFRLRMSVETTINEVADAVGAQVREQIQP